MHNRCIGNSRGRRIYSQLFVRYQLQFQLDVNNLAFVHIFIFSFSIDFGSGRRFSNALPSPMRNRYMQPSFNVSTLCKTEAVHIKLDPQTLIASPSLQHICKAHKNPITKPTLQKSCNCQHTATVLIP